MYRAVMPNWCLLILIGIVIVNAFEGIPDSEDRKFLFHRDGATYIFLETVPESFDFTLTYNDQLHSPRILFKTEKQQPFTCPGSMNFTLKSYDHIYDFLVQAKGVATAIGVFKCPEKPKGETGQILFSAMDSNMNSAYCPLISQPKRPLNLRFRGRTLDFSCPVQLYLGPEMTMKPAAKPYPLYSRPSNPSLYHQRLESMPERYFSISSTDLTIDVFSGNPYESEYSYYKGKGRPIPSMKFKNGECYGVSAFITLAGCAIQMEYQKEQIMATVNEDTKKIPLTADLYMLVFTLSDVYLQTRGPLWMKHLGKCDFGNSTAKSDDFEMKVRSKIDWYDHKCDLKLVVDRVLIRRKPPVRTTAVPVRTTVRTTKVTEVVEEVTAKSASVSFWYYVVGCISVIVIIAAIVAIILILRLNRKKKPLQIREIQQPQQQKSPVVPTSEFEEPPLDATQEDKELPTPPPVVKQPMPTTTKPPMKKDETTNKALKSASAHAIRLREPRINRTGKKEFLPPMPDTEKTVKTRTQRTTVGSMTQQHTENSSNRINKPIDYHDKEPTELVPMEINYSAADNKVEPTTFDNFWAVMESAGEVARFSPVFISDANDNFENVIFYVRNLKMLPGSPFKRLANRILEPMPKVGPGPNGEERIALRVFITSYVPLTIEVHMIGKPPEMIFNICDCKQCRQLGQDMAKGRLFKAMCIDPWPLLLCRLKRVPVNHHCFVSVTNPTDKTKIHHIFIIRGTKDPPVLLPCERGCNVGSAFYHLNGFVLKSGDQRTLTIRTETTQDD